MPPSATPSPPSPGPWRTFWIASAAVFLVLLDTTAVVAAYAPLRTCFSGAAVAKLGPAGAGLARFQTVHILLALLGLATAALCLPVDTRPLPSATGPAKVAP